MRFNTNTHCNEGLLDCVHVCIWEPAKTASLGGHRYFVSFIDSVSRQCWIYPMRQCSEALDILVKWKGKMKRQIGRRIKELKIGNVGKDMYQFLRFGHNTGIVTHFTTGTDELAKEVIRPLLNEVRRLLSNTGLDKSFWAEATVYASHLMNRSTAIGGKAPLEIWSGKATQDHGLCGNLEVRPTSVPRMAR